MPDNKLIEILARNDLRITPQRIAVLEVILNLEFHPSAEDIVNYIKLSFPHVPIGTVYKILDAFEKKGIINRVKTDSDTVRYDAVKEKHHHLYAHDSDRIEDYFDDDLNKLLTTYFKKKKIPNFEIKEFKLQIMGKFTNKQAWETK
ncbi:MAG: transcriptional repressor [Bacteroidales bacterium]|nr:transcriptional repressor [Bacteroidales bacterium]